MKRVALIRNARSYDFGGAEIFSISLARQLDALGHAPIIMGAHKKTLSAARRSGLRVAKAPWWSFQDFSGSRVLLFPLYIMWSLLLMMWYFGFFLKNRIDVAHPQSRDDFIAATIAAKLLGRKVVWTDHADLKHVYMNHGKWYKNPVGKLVYFVGLLADCITLESHSEGRLIAQSLGKPLPKNYRVIHIGVVDTYKASRRSNSKPTLVSTSRLVTDKGIGELIEAFKSLEHDSAVLKICGDGPEANHFKKLATGVKNIEFLGHVNDVTTVLAGADIFVHPTYHEGFGLSLVEAEMCSLPIIASNVGSIPEIVEDGISGILVEPRNSQALAEVMARLIGDAELRSHMGEAGREIFLENFQFDKIVKEKFVPIYERA